MKIFLQTGLDRQISDLPVQSEWTPDQQRTASRCAAFGERIN
jgi:hypothetical protein